mmetsp:Transcript_51814/g.125061  ORF Transcript_51814/g.125061 Transcript_51814/m.125061 type:complete len:125 (-) Transcript_51814:1060-1434(-)
MEVGVPLLFDFHQSPERLPDLPSGVLKDAVEEAHYHLPVCDMRYAVVEGEERDNVVSRPVVADVYIKKYPICWRHFESSRLEFSRGANGRNASLHRTERQIQPSEIKGQAIPVLRRLEIPNLWK